MKTDYIELMQRVERLHRQSLEVIKEELERLGIRDLNAVQAMILFNLGSEQMTVSELTHRGCYQGSNVSYNVKKLTELGYLSHVRSPHDRRSIYLSCTEQGAEICQYLDELFASNAEEVAGQGIDAGALDAGLAGVERFLATFRASKHGGSRRVA